MTEYAELRKWVHGHTPVPARLEPWQVQLLEDAEAVRALLRDHGSPVNILETSALARHAAELTDAADVHGIDLRVYFARKANKSLAVVDAALEAGLGVDVASHTELVQVLGRGAPADRVIVTAAVKPSELLREAFTHRVPVAVDNLDELAAMVELAGQMAEDAGEVPPETERVPGQETDRRLSGARPVVLRLAPEVEGIPVSRFGLRRAEVVDALTRWPEHLEIVGLHFHLTGYSAEQRALMLHSALDTADLLAGQGHRPQFIDIGGGIPMAYTDDRRSWEEFQRSVSCGGEPLAGRRPLGTVYPMWQESVRGEWLRSLLSHSDVGSRLRESGLRLHMEPGRALMDGAGMTLARVAFRKELADGSQVVGLEMNRTQVRSAADDFILDPLLVPAADRGGSRPVDAFVVGAYCIEEEFITRRRLHFPRGVAVGDVLAFPNTAGYMMHILESTSHRMPLARNVIHVRHGEQVGWVLDPIDASR